MDGYSRAVYLWQPYEITSAADPDKYLHSFPILLPYHFGKIEKDESQKTWAKALSVPEGQKPEPKGLSDFTP